MSKRKEEVLYRHSRVYRNIFNDLYVQICNDYRYDYKVKDDDDLQEGDKVDVIIRRTYGTDNTDE